MKKISYIILFAIFVCAADLYAQENIESEILKEWRELTSSQKPFLSSGKTKIPGNKIVSMTMFLNKVRKNWNSLSSSTQDLLSPMLMRPTEFPNYVQGKNISYSSGYDTFETTHFKIFYAEDGGDAPPNTIPNSPIPPDFVKILASAFESSYIAAVNKGYAPPPSDISANNNGGNDKYDVYLLDIARLDRFPKTFGWTQAEGRYPPSDTYVNYSIIVMDNDYNTTQYDTSQSPEDFARITAAHEFFHAIEFGYNINVDGWFMEASAVWFEDQIFPNINDYVKRYLTVDTTRCWFWSPELPLDYEGNLHEYGSGIWPMFLEKYDSNIIRKSFEEANKIEQPNTFSILDTLLKNKGGLYSSFGEFTAWNFIYDTTHYDDGALYAADTALYIFDTITAGYMTATVHAVSKPKLPGYLGSNYIIFNTTGSSVRIMFDGDESFSKNLLWNASVIKKYGTTYTDTTINLNNRNAGGITISSSFDSIILIPSIYETTHLRSDTTSFGYTYGFSNDTTAPGPVPALAAIDRPGDQGKFIRLNWSASPSDTAGAPGSDIESYDILRSTASVTGFNVVAYYSPNGSGSYTYDDIVDGNMVNYYYKIRARDKWLNFDTTGELYTTAMAIDNTTPDPPTNVKVNNTPKSEYGNSIDITWTKSPDDESGANDVVSYTVFRSLTRTDTTLFQTAGVVNSGKEIFQDTAVINGNTYYYYVRVEDGNPNYSYCTAYYFYNTATTDTSHDASIKAEDKWISPPREFKAVGINDRIALAWKNPDVSDFVKTFIRTKPVSHPVDTTDGTDVPVVTDSTSSDANIIIGQTYYYAAFSLDTTGNYSVPDTGSRTQASITLKAFNYPNPTFSGNTTIRYQLENTSGIEATLYIFDIAGELVLKIDNILSDSNNSQPVASVPVYDFNWDGKNGKGHQVSSGVYIFIVEANDSISKKDRTGKIAVIK